jgi:membrane protein DedA with SNARE-associated domain
MPRFLTLFALTTLAWAVCLLGLSWLAEAGLGRALSVGEWLVLGVLLTLLAGLAVRRYRQRHRRRLQDMRDSALW